MTTQLIIEGELVRVVETNIVREVKLEDMLPHMEYRPPITIGMLPSTAKFIHWDESGKTKRVSILSELAAGVRHCIRDNRRYQLSIPWTYFLFEMSTAGEPMLGESWILGSTSVYWAREPIRDLDSQLGMALTPNCNTEGTICFGTTGVDARMPLGSRIDRTVHEFYRTMFTHDSGTGAPWGSQTGVTNWKRWEEESKKDPAAFLKMPEWEKTRGIPRIQPYKTVRSILRQVTDRAQPIVMEGMIPEMATPMTFGRAEEWLATLTAVDRYRLNIALQNMHADEPTIIEEPTILPGQADPNDIGGELIV